MPLLHGRSSEAALELVPVLNSCSGGEVRDTLLSRVREETPGRDIYKAREGWGWGEKSERENREDERQTERLSELRHLDGSLRAERLMRAGLCLSREVEKNSLQV